ncbi:MAG: heme-binding protein [Woeseiaceae bacterium]|nr:heme-binding protein [Woeseiaceae bacterium]
MNTRRALLVLKAYESISKKILLLTCTIFLGGTVNAIEEPEYQVISKNQEFETRHYSQYLVAEVILDGDFKSSGNQAFRVLAGYIFGDNKAAEKMAMTAPVESQMTNSSEKMAMTAPVLSIDGEGKYIYRFVMEKRYKLDTLPTPNDTRIRLHEVKPRYMAVKRFSGSWSEKNYKESEKALLQSLSDRNIQTIGLPIFARYNAPFVPWFLRRNEIMIEIDRTD